MSADQLSMFEEENGAEKPASKFKSFNVSLSRTLPVPAEKIFDRWLIPTFVGKWMFGEHLGNEKVIDLQNEVRPGGTYNYKITRNGKEVLHDGEYLQIDRPKRLSFSWREAAKKTAHKSKVNLSLDPQDGKTKLKLTMQIDQSLEHYGDEIKQQWSERLKALSTQLSK
ncbi:MAG: SRPBCC family protein [Pseudohongiellaceae bacterium]